MEQFREIFVGFISYGLPILAFVISLYSVIQSRKSNKLNEQVLEMDKRLKEIELEKANKEIQDANNAEVECRIVKEFKDRYRLKVWNSGGGVAYNVNFEEDTVEDFIQHDKVPYEYLESSKSFEEIVTPHFGVPNKFVIKTSWENSDGDIFEKDNIVTI